MIFDSWRRQWELPGGKREPGETARQAAMRELAEEIGIEAVDMDFVAVAECNLRRPNRWKYTALYRTDLQMAPQLVINDDALASLWWNPQSSMAAHMNALDAEMARRTTYSNSPWLRYLFETPPADHRMAYTGRRERALMLDMRVIFADTPTWLPGPSCVGEGSAWLIHFVSDAWC